MKFLLYLVTCFLLLNVSATTQSLIKDSCKKAASKNRKLKLDFCLKSLEGCKQCKTANNLTELTTASMKNTRITSKKMRDKMKKDFDARKYPKDNDLLVMECLNDYSGTSQILNSAMETFKEGDYKDVIERLNYATEGLDACDEGYKERSTPQISPFLKNNEFLSHLIQIPIAFTEMLR
ncbi:unnamed protein product [Eruca vesicaria subsp. sativa]|uniref:Pectinesterase inhibitor domain-containing protein n=1 Tax=Eruca vesicaria subsp. sativa TaxID=29727 RepID=A0ABC8LGP3_ERUVS|nr:unnamed protein product [Eruca vesicaria subsp. sativa]